jgi:hypothetical protein
MINSTAINSAPVNGPSALNLNSSTNTDGALVFCAGRNRKGVRHRGTSVIIVLENNQFDENWVVEFMRIKSRLAGRRRD